jgi:hypothetical protein
VILQFFLILLHWLSQYKYPSTLTAMMSAPMTNDFIGASLSLTHRQRCILAFVAKHALVRGCIPTHRRRAVDLARAKALSPERRRAIAKKAAKTRWGGA